jgi:hypothetical protein
MSGIVGTGTTLSIGGADVGKLLSLNVDGVSVTDIDVTNMTSTGFREYIASTLKDAGTLSGELLAEAGAFDPDEIGGDPAAVAIAGGEFTWSGAHGYFSSKSVSVPVEDKVTVSFTIRLTAPTT